jgi:hypothetical protein
MLYLFKRINSVSSFKFRLRRYKSVCLVSARINRDKDKVFNDFVAGKGRGINVCSTAYSSFLSTQLTHLFSSSPEVKKTLTAFLRPLDHYKILPICLN